VDTLDITSWFDGVLKLKRFREIIRDFRPNVVHTWLYHANTVGGVAAYLWSDAKIVWGLHSGWLAADHTKRLTRIMRTTGQWLSRYVPDKIICCAHCVQEFHAGLGYDSSKLAIIPNGVDLERFRPDEFARRKLRNQWGVSSTQLVVGMVARFDPQKDFRTFLDAAIIVREHYPAARFVLCGRGFSAENAVLIEELERRGLQQHVILLGLRYDVPRVMAALDTLVLSSLFGEALPLVVIEAMACGVPVVATDMGDLQRVIGGCGIVAQAQSAHQFAEGILWYAQLSATEKRRVTINARERIAAMFPLSSAIDQHEALYSQILGLSQQRPRTDPARPGTQDEWESPESTGSGVTSRL
jgi:glycosyltransferase involved in cell wall biosynthesis